MQMPPDKNRIKVNTTSPGKSGHSGVGRNNTAGRVSNGSRPQPMSKTQKSAMKKSTQKSSQRKNKTNPYIQKAPPKKSGKNIKRVKRNKRNYSVYYAMFFIFTIVAVFVLSRTVLFNINRIIVVGESSVSNDEIIAVTGLSVGDNLFSFNEKDIEALVFDAVLDVDSVRVEKALPSELRIHLVQATPIANLVDNDSYALLSSNGRVLNTGLTEKVENIPVVKGFSSEPLVAGEIVTSKLEDKKKLLDNFLQYLAETDLTNITEINITDKFALKFIYDGRVTCELGTAENLKEKINAASITIKDKIKVNEKVIMLINDPDTVYVRNDEDRTQTTQKTETPLETSPSDENVTEPENSTSNIGN